MKENYQNSVGKLTQALSYYSELENKIKTISARYLYELAELVCDKVTGASDLAEELRSAYKEVVEPCKVNFMRNDEALIADHIANVLNDRGINMNFSLFGIIPSEKPGVVSYVKNAYSDMAYRVFDQGIGGIFSEYADSFALAAQSVYYENASACLLPISADDGSMMTGIAKLVEKYDLKKSGVAGIATGGIQNTRFALFTHGLWENSVADTVEFTVKSEDPFSVERIMASARIFGFERVSHTERVSTDSGEVYDLFSLKGVGRRSFISLLIYLTLEFERFNLTGIYKEFE